jgi:hypothetical protein
MKGWTGRVGPERIPALSDFEGGEFGELRELRSWMRENWELGRAAVVLSLDLGKIRFRQGGGNRTSVVVLIWHMAQFGR